MVRNDDHYIDVRMTEDERTGYDEKLAKTYYTGKLFLLKLLDGEKLREKVPKEEREVHNQLFRIENNCFHLWAGNNTPDNQAHVYYSRYRYLEKYMADITSIVYQAHLWEND